MEFNLKNELSKGDISVFAEIPDRKLPFDLFIFSDVLEKSAINQLKTDIKTGVELNQKDNDLYKFKQSKDVRCEMDSAKLGTSINEFIDNMIGPVRRHLEELTNSKLSNINFDITVSRYDCGDYLLCHNDDIKAETKEHKRALAFVYYLNSRPWTTVDGGSLILYDSDQNGEPVQINNRISPKPNTLVVFKTSSKSWHSVEEVLCSDDTRWSINGWFHTDEPEAEDLEEPHSEPSLYEFFRPKPVEDGIEKFFNEYISEQYATERNYYMIRKKFKRTSEINLTNFLKKDKYDQICKALKEAVAEESNLKQIGPYNKRNYKRIEVDKLPKVCQDVYAAFHSELFFLLLNRLTGLDLRPETLRRDEEHATTSEEDDSDEDDDESDDESEGDEGEDESGDDAEVEDEDESEPPIEAEDEDSKRETQATGSDETDPKIDDNAGEHESKPSTGSKSKNSDQTEKQPKKRKRLADPIGRTEFRHFEHGSYTMLHDHDFEVNELSALDVILHFNHDCEVDVAHGGYISYIDGGSNKEDMHESETELLSVEPKSNCLSLVYRGDGDTCRFLKYITKSHKTSYQDLSCVYYERPDELPKQGVGVLLDGQRHRCSGV